MAVTVTSIVRRKIQAGQNGYVLVEGIAAFSTTDLTGDIDTGLKNIFDESIQQSYKSNVTAAESLSVAKSATAGTLSFTRVGASVLTGAIFRFSCKGTL